MPTITQSDRKSARTYRKSRKKVRRMSNRRRSVVSARESTHDPKKPNRRFARSQKCGLTIGFEVIGYIL